MVSLDVSDAGMLSGIAGLLGLASHLLYFIHSEHHVHVRKIVKAYLSLTTMIPFSIAFIGRRSYGETLMLTISIVVSYAASLFSSIISYRLFFHPLRKFPGPFWARVSKFWNVYHARNSDNYRVMEKLRHQYGEYVRTGPNELTIFRPEAVKAMDGNGTTCVKAPWYDIMLPRVSVATTRNKVAHDERRKLWDKAFSSANLKEKQPRIKYFANQLREYISRSKGNFLNVSFVFYMYSFDFMSETAFGKALDALKHDKNHDAIRLLHQGMALLGPFSPVPWLVRIATALPYVADKFVRLLEWSSWKLKQRVESNIKEQDTVTWLLNGRQPGPSMLNDPWLRGDCFAIVVAGSDTVASTLVSIFYYLVTQRRHVSKIREEIDNSLDFDEMDFFKPFPHLDAMVNESLRLHPALPSGGLRDTPSRGMTIGDRFIPGSVTITAPRYSLGRLETSYLKPYEFIPERWYSAPELVADASGFSPFGHGRYSCSGRRLAMAQIRSVVTAILTDFDVSFATHEDGIPVWRDLADQFNAHPGWLSDRKQFYECCDLGQPPTPLACHNT